MAARTVREQLEELVPRINDLANEIDRKALAGENCDDDIELLTKQLDDNARLTAAFKATATAGGTIDVAKAFLADLVGAPVKAESMHSSGIVDPKGMTLGEAFTKSPAYQEFVSGYKGSNGAIMNVPIQKAANFEVGGAMFSAGGKALITGLSDTSGGAFVITDRLGTTVDLIGERPLSVRALCTNINITSDTFDYVTVTGKTNAAAGVLEATTSATPGLNGVAVGAYTAAHGVKPESALTLAVVSSIVETIAHMIPISRRAAADSGQVMQLVNKFLLYGLGEEEEDQILNGSGATPQLRGILQTAGIGTVGSAGTDIDAIVDAINAIRQEYRNPNALVIHPNDWYSTGFLLAKNGVTGGYLVGDPRASIDQLNQLWGLRVVVTPAMTVDTALVGDFSQAVVADRQQGTIYMTDSHNDHFARNILDILAEERLGFGVLDPKAFCTVTAI